MFQIAGKEPEALTGFDRRARQYQAADLAAFERFDAFDDGKVGFSGARRPQCDGDLAECGGGELLPGTGL